MNYITNSRVNVYNYGQLENLSSIRKYKEYTDKNFVFLDIISVHVDEKTE